MDILSNLKPIGDLFLAGRYTEALTELERLWGEVPTPKEATLNSYLIVASGAAVALKAERLNDAWTWAQRGLPYTGNFNLMGESEFLVGEIAFARSDYETAIKYFKAAKKMSGWRLFKNKDPKYRRLIEDP